MRCLALILAFCLTSWPLAAHAQEVSIGVAAPSSGNFSILGKQLLDGARVASEAAEARVTIVEADTGCSAEGGQAAARAFAEHAVSAVVGFLCTDAIEAALPLLKEAGIPVVTPGVRTATLTDQRQRSGWPVFRAAPRADAERDAVADLLVRRWRREFFAIVDDGTIYGRELAETLRAAAELQELKPVFVDTFRPQLDNQIGLAGRLRRAGATHVFVGGDRSDIAILARDAKAMDYMLTIAGGEALRAETSTVPLAAGTLMVGLPQWADVAAPEALAALSDAEVVPDGYVLPAFAATQIALAAARDARAEETTVGEALASGTFETALGSLSFDAKGDLSTGFYRLFRFDGETFVEAE
ncbi:branched-chain amino acid ABC transporter substrate-binding protein [Nitratireductor sp. ZSWI3]|uniref:branched-chain amino acid ABC transporter substrate-binding protein n=1 Tax=Nitratireductor sp. ZSWI3 TaxID=2966359 RepID=UPI00214FDD73|nr:branched-chain amino acid ABC transporter substrate-binding protein [Nitratireductor sp. ZSWI3]MCR4266262.1 branched-chain amino acid ABC transporter substrate-binding protein [Nitratireductor sp. ZSWI3]